MRVERCKVMWGGIASPSASCPLVLLGSVAGGVGGSSMLAPLSSKSRSISSGCSISVTGACAVCPLGVDSVRLAGDELSPFCCW